MNSTSMSGALVASLVLAVAGTSTAQIAAYHGVSGATHQTRFTSLAGSGYRMLSLDVHGTGTPEYTAIWAKRSGPAFSAFHDAKEAAYVSLKSSAAANGFRPQMVSVAGSGATATYAGTFVKDGVSAYAKHNLTKKQFVDEVAWALDTNYVLTWMQAYGTAADPRYLGVFEPNTKGIHWGVSLDIDPAEFQAFFDAATSAWARPAFVTLSDTMRYSVIWRDEPLPGYTLSTGLTAAGYQNAVDNLPSGYYPLLAQAGLSGSSGRYALLAVPSETPVARSFTVQGLAVAGFEKFDDYVKQKMQGNGARAAGLAIARDGRLVYARGYTWAEAGYPATTPTSVFRIASMAKPITAIAVHRAYETGKLSAGQTIPQVLGISQASMHDTRFAAVTLDHCLTHRGGWDAGTSKFDPVFGDRTVASTLAVPLPVTRDQVQQYMTARYTMDFAPGADSRYSNYGFLLAGLALEKVNPGMSYEQIVQRDVFSRLGLTRPRMGESLQANILWNEVRYHPRIPTPLRTSVANGNGVVARQYGGWNQRTLGPNGGWVMSAVDYARILASFDLPTNPMLRSSSINQMWSGVGPSFPNTMRGWFRVNLKNRNGLNVMGVQHNGGLAGTSTVGVHRTDGLSIVLFFNQDLKDGLFGDREGVQLNDLANTMTWPNHDLFPSYGLKSFYQGYGPSTYTTYGTGCAGSNGTPALVPYGTPEIGTASSIAIEQGKPGAVAMLAIGNSKTVWGGAVLPMDLGFLGAPGCKLLQNLSTTLPRTLSANGRSTQVFSLPHDTSLIGARAFMQGVIFDSANAFGVVTTNGVDALVGGWR